MSIARALPYLLLAVLLGAAGYLAGAVTDPFGSGQPSVRGALAPEEPRLRRELEQARGEAAALTGELQRAQVTIDRLRADLDEARTRIAELQQRAEAAEEARTAAEDRIAELAERVAKLEAEGAGDGTPAVDAEAAPDNTADATGSALTSGQADGSADGAADGSDTSATVASASPDESASGEAAPNVAASPSSPGTAPDTETGQVAEQLSATADSDTAAGGDTASGGDTQARDDTETRSAPSAPAAASDRAGPPADADIAGIGPPGFEEDPRPSSDALSSISPSTRQANRLVAGVQAYQDAAYQEAFLAWLPLAQAGYARAQLHLGALFLEGRGTDRNDPLAYAWLTIAQNNGSQNAGPLLDQLQQRMSAEDLDTAQELLGRARQAAGSAG